MIKLRLGLVLAFNLFIAAAAWILAGINGSEIGERINSLAFVMFPVVGVVLLARHPRNPIGYLVTVLGLAVQGANALFMYSLLSLNEGMRGLPLTGEAAWLSFQLWTLVLPCLSLTLLLFPNGRLPGPGWKALVVFIFALNLPILLICMATVWPHRNLLAQVDVGLAPQSPEMAALFAMYDVWNLVMIGVIILALVSFFFRFSRSTGIERQQLKWFVFGLTTIPTSMVLEEFLVLIDAPVFHAFNYVFSIISIVAFPVVMLIAITRYRLYDIDFIIRRTLLYSALTLTLALVYFGVVLVAQSLFAQSVFANRTGEQPAIVIVLSTLLIAALFQPLRRRFQSVIDRRFYRSKYNAEQMLERFATRLQNEVDLTAIECQFVSVVEENIQPENTQLWLIRKTELPGG